MPVYSKSRFIRQIITLTALLILFLCNMCYCEDVLSNRIFSLTNRDASEIIKAINEMGIAESANKVRNVNAIIITATPENLVKATALVGLMDSKTNFSVRYTENIDIKNIENIHKDIEANIRDISVGSFRMAPVGDKKYKAILDIHNKKAVLIAPDEIIDEIESSIPKKTKQAKTAKKVVEETKKPEPKPEAQSESSAKTDLEDKSVLEEIEKMFAEAEQQLESEKAQPIEKKQAPANAEQQPSKDEFFDEIVSKLEDVEAKQAKETKTSPKIKPEAMAKEATPIIELKPEVKPQPEKKLPAVKEEIEKQLETEPNVAEKAQLDIKELFATMEKAQSKQEHVKAKQELTTKKEIPETNELDTVITIEDPIADETKKDTQNAVPLAEPIIPDGNTVLELELPEKVNIVNLLDLIGEYMQLDYMYDEKQVQGDITLKIQGPITIKDLYAYVEAILKSKGFAMVRGRGNLVMIVKSADAIKFDPEIVSPERGVQAGNVFVTNVFQLEHIDTATAVKLLNDMKMGITSIVPVNETNSIIVTDYAYRMQRIEDLLALVDMPGDPKVIKFRQIEHIAVSSLIPKLTKLANELGTVKISATVSTPTAKKPTRGRAPTPAKPTTTTTSEKHVVFLEADERTNRIIMIGTKNELETVEQLIDSLDIKQVDLKRIQSYEIQNLAAEEVQDKLVELGIATSSSGKKSKGISGPAAKPGTAAATSVPQDVEEDLAQVVLLESTNSLLINGTPEQHEQIQMIIAYIDRATSESATPYVIYHLEYQTPVELAETLNNIVEQTVNVKDEKGKIVKAPTGEEEDITIVPDEASFSLIVYANRKNQEWIGNLIQSLDQKRPQVLIDVTLVEITQTDTFEADLEVISAIPDLSVTSGLVSTGTIGTGISEIFDGDQRDRFIELGNNSGSGQVFYGDKHIQALLTLVETKNYGRILANPRITVNDNVAGSINTTTTTYVTKTDTTTVETGTITTTDYPSYEAGINLTITPHISEGELLLLEIALSRSDFTGDLGGERPPDSVSTDIETLVTVPDGKTIILGGLVKLNQGKGTTKVPGFGDLPLVGALFRSSSNSDTQSKLYVFVKAHVSRPREDVRGLPDLERISRRAQDAFEEAEKEFQEYQEAVPGLDTKMMTPRKVLEME